MKIAIHQPNFLPNLAYFYKMIQVDLFIVVSNLQFERYEGWQRRHKIPAHDRDLWLTVPVLGSQNQKIKDVRINNKADWRRKHMRALQLRYSRTPEPELLSQILKIYPREWSRLVDINMAFISLLKNYMGIQTSVVLDEDAAGVKEELIISTCRKYGADEYVSGMGGKNYLTEQHFAKMTRQGIACSFIDKDLSTSYPYTTLHYLLTDGLDKVRSLFAS